MPSFSAFNDSVRCCCRTRGSCWMSSLSAFNDSGGTACSGVVRGGGLSKNCYTSRYLVFILLWIGWHSTQSINTRSKSAGNTFIHAFVSFCPIIHVLSAHYFLKLPLFRNSYPGSRGTHSSPFPTAVRSFVLIARKKGSELSFLPWSPLASNWCTFMQATSIIRSTRAARRFLRSVCILLLWFQA